MLEPTGAELTRATRDLTYAGALAALLRGEVGVEHALENMGRHADTVVADGDPAGRPRWPAASTQRRTGGLG